MLPATGERRVYAFKEVSFILPYKASTTEI